MNQLILFIEPVEMQTRTGSSNLPPTGSSRDTFTTQMAEKSYIARNSINKA